MSRKRKHDDFREVIGPLLETGKFSDFTITCGDKTWNVHKAVICTQSDYFDAASRFGKEAAEAKIDLKDDDPEIVGYLLDYMYQGDYGAACDGSHHRWMQIAWDSDSMEAAGRRKLYKWDNFVYLTTRRLFSEEENGTSKCSRKCPHGHSHVYRGKPRLDYKEDVTGLEKYNGRGVPIPGLVELTTHAKVYTSADKYLMEGLKAVAGQKFQDTIRHYYLFACDRFYETIEEILEITPDSDTTLRDMIVERVRNEKAIYGIRHHPALKSALRDIPGLAYWVMCKEEEEFPPIDQLFDVKFYRQ